MKHGNDKRRRRILLLADFEQKIVEALYIYLLEKREENNMTHVINAQNLRIISPPMGDWKPVFPKKGVTLLIALLTGIILPAITIYLRRNISSILNKS